MASDAPTPSGDSSRWQRAAALESHPSSAQPFQGHFNGGVAVVELPDAGLMHTLDEVQDRVESMLDEAPQMLVVDLSDRARLSSTTVAALLWVRRRCMARGVSLEVRHASRRAADVLDRIGFFGRLPTEVSPWRPRSADPLD